MLRLRTSVANRILSRDGPFQEQSIDWNVEAEPRQIEVQSWSAAEEPNYDLRTRWAKYQGYRPRNQRAGKPRAGSRVHAHL